MKRFHFEVKGNPVPMQRARMGKYGNFYVPQETKDYEESIKWHCVAIMGKVNIKSNYLVRMDFGLEKNVGDLDNYVKCVFDALQGVVWKDDKQVIEMHASKFVLVNGEKGFADIEIIELKGGENG